MFPYNTRPKNKNTRKNLPKKTAAEQAKIEQLREKLLEECDFKNITNEQLVALQKNTTKRIETLITERNYVEARKYQELSSKIDHEARRRIDNTRLAPQKPVTFPKNSVEGKKLIKFDQETEKGILQMKQRHESLLNNFDQLWDSQIRNKYFQDSPQLASKKREYNQNARTMSKQDAKDLRDEIEELENQENMENSQNFECDYNSSREQMILKQRKEMQLYMSERKRARQAMLPSQPIMPDKSLNQAKAKLANRDLARTANPKEGPRIIAPDTTQRSQSKSRSSPMRPNSKLAPLPPAKPEVATQTDPVSDSELFDDDSNEGVETEDDIIQCGEETSKIMNSMLDETVSEVISEIQNDNNESKEKDFEDDGLLNNEELDKQTKDMISNLFNESYSGIISDITGNKKPVLSLGDAIKPVEAIAEPVKDNNEDADIFDKTKLESVTPVEEKPQEDTNNNKPEEKKPLEINLTDQVQEKISETSEKAEKGDEKPQEQPQQQEEQKKPLEINVTDQVQEKISETSEKAEKEEEKPQEQPEPAKPQEEPKKPLAINLTDQFQEKVAETEQKTEEAENVPPKQPSPEQKPALSIGISENVQQKLSEKKEEPQQENAQQKGALSINLTDQIQEKISDTEKKAEETENKPKEDTKSPQNSQKNQPKSISASSSASPLLSMYAFGSNDEQKPTSPNPLSMKLGNSNNQNSDQKQREITDISAPTQESGNNFDANINIEDNDKKLVKNNSEDTVGELPNLKRDENKGQHRTRSRKNNLISTSMSEDDLMAIIHPRPPEHVALQNAKLAQMATFSLKVVPSLEDDVQSVAMRAVDQCAIGAITFLALVEEITDEIAFQTIDEVCDTCIQKA
ncbi:hypothetical protein TVAG_287890 [Trichomonas vaginalis G3]|uniref:Uncharacterized protein n=1 Tax=Trichomonas vaginalis (strain ATCC PRA-98 / G3) TaxID=412133 RepID=A2ER56_TRIV3|nr:hypothetical protein TVAGG3_0183530 [Trichomonas vaginalis G3]EAY04875.1 hypothetical protein TVAG_287890 [Trichomonas vaginalis G3]KAI5549467.1 hypothetical protein TVAGG3_0183530 [Trichomonas vaginalis G3]|eukprot:XP_001317098.1 hypothetical protein [Trichomonas vaginalis G3]